MTQRNIQLDGLRGYAALNVAIFHALLAVDPTLERRILYTALSDLPDAYAWYEKIVLRIFSGETAVYIFFVLSGAVLIQSLMRDASHPVRVAGGFAVRRFFRIYPALIVCLLFTAAANNLLGHHNSLDDLITNLLLIDFPVNGATWTLNVEMVAVPFLLLTYAGWRMFGLAGLLIVAALLSALFDSPAFTIAVKFKSFWIYFVFGMLVPTKIGEFVATRAPTWSWIPALAVLVIFKGTLQQIAIFHLVALLFYHRAGALMPLLGASISQFLGLISYGFYLYHVVVVERLGAFVRQTEIAKNHPLEIGILIAPVVIAATIPLAYLSLRVVEMPGIRAGRRLAPPPRAA